MVRLTTGKLYIDGRLREATGGALYDDIGPWTGEVVAQAADATAADMEEAIAAARRAFDETEWSRDHARRIALVRAFGAKLIEAREELSDIARHEVGSALGCVYGPQVNSAIEAVEPLVAIAEAFDWEEDRGIAAAFGIASRRRVRHEGVGVVAAITPWNVPLYVNIAKIVPALLAGCTVILKPAPETPLSGAILGRIADEVGFPAGTLQVLTGSDPAMLGEMLTTDPRIDLVTFTGSTPIGKRIMEKAAADLKRVFLELGGKSARIVLDDAPDYAAAVGGAAVIYHAGQGCAVLTRLLLPRSRYDEGVAILEQAYKRIEWGGFDEARQIMGPLVSARQRERVMGYIEAGKSEGARLIAGGNARPDMGDGFFVEPTCFVDVTNDMTIAREEIFGPVLVVIPYEDDDDAIRIANDSPYGLSGGVISADPARARYVAERVRSGTFSVNGGMWNFADMPFGGYKQSGVGREWGKEGFMEYLEVKVVAERVAA